LYLLVYLFYGLIYEDSFGVQHFSNVGSLLFLAKYDCLVCEFQIASEEIFGEERGAFDEDYFGEFRDGLC